MTSLDGSAFCGLTRFVTVTPYHETGAESYFGDTVGSYCPNGTSLVEFVCGPVIWSSRSEAEALALAALTDPELYNTTRDMYNPAERALGGPFTADVTLSPDFCVAAGDPAGAECACRGGVYAECGPTNQAAPVGHGRQDGSELCEAAASVWSRVVPDGAITTSAACVAAGAAWTPSCVDHAPPSSLNCSATADCVAEADRLALASTPPPPATLQAELELAVDIESIPEGTAARLVFEAAFRADVAAALGIEPTRVRVLGVEAGSVVVAFEVLPDPAGAPVDMRAAARALVPGMN
eukprot:SAG11_NODE_215_length_12235_cov_11.843276_6_plen_295_part_00